MKRGLSRVDDRVAVRVNAGWLVAAAMLTNMRADGQQSSVGLSNEVTKAADVFLADSELNVRWRNLQREVSLTAAAATLQMDYLPSEVDLLGKFQELEDSRCTGQLTWREGLDQPWRWIFSAGGYEGFTDYRSLWLNEYYRQLFSGTSGYQAADVGGLNASIGGTYEYLPQSGMLNWSVGWQMDDVAPPYEKTVDGPLVRGLSRYETWRYGLGSEHVLSPWLRFKQDVTAFQTTSRAWRYAYKAETACAITDTWVARLSAEGSREAGFYSGAVGLQVEHDWESRWFAGIMVRAYRDNGQILDPLLISGSPPPLDTLQALMTLRYSGPDLTMRLAVGPYLTRYAEPAPGTLRFSTLYRDRDWLNMQVSLTKRF
jgi:hypothetical protein